MQDWLFADQGQIAGPPGCYKDWAGDPLPGVPLTIEIRYSQDGTTYGDWIVLPYGRELKLRSYQFRFTWTPYIPGWHFTFDDLKIKVYRRNRKVPKSIVVPAGGDVFNFGYSFLQLPTVQVTSRTAGISFHVSAVNQDGSGNYVSATVGAYDIATGAAIVGPKPASMFIDGY
nr:peptidase C16 family [uncultured bacterium]